MSHAIAGILEARDQYSLSLPPTISVTIRPQVLARAVVGHLLAAEIRDDMHTPPRRGATIAKMRSYFMDRSLDFPDDMELLLWTYPATRQLVLRSVGLIVLESRSRHIIYSDCLKLFPVAFWVAQDFPRSLLTYARFQPIDVRGRDFDSKIAVHVPTASGIELRPDWPECPGDDTVLAIHSEFCYIADEVNGSGLI